MSSDEGDDSFPQTFFDRKQTEPSAWDEVSDSEEPTKRTPEDCKDILEAAEDGYLEMVRKFIEQNPSCINVPDEDGYTALHRACYNNHVEVVKYLLEHGADVGARTNDGWQPIHSSAQWGNVQILRILCSWGADLNSKTVGGNTPFHLAVSKPRNGQLIEYLLFHDDVDIEAINDAGDSPYNICKRYSKHYKLWEFL